MGFALEWEHTLALQLNYRFLVIAHLYKFALSFFYDGISDLSEALRHLAETQPSHYVKGGLKSLRAGVVSTVAGFFAGPSEFVGLPSAFGYTQDHLGGWLAAIGYTGSVVLTIGGTLYGLRKLADGATSFFDPLLQHRRDGSVYHRNEGYVSDHSRFDRMFGSVIRPIEESSQLDEIKNKRSFKSPELFINGATLKNARFQKEVTRERRRDGKKVTEKRTVSVLPQEILDNPLPVGYTALATVEFDGKEFSAGTGNGGVVKYLAGREAGTALRLRGGYDFQYRKYVFNMKEIDDPLLRDAA